MNRCDDDDEKVTLLTDSHKTDMQNHRAIPAKLGGRIVGGRNIGGRNIIGVRWGGVCVHENA